ncbi:MAG: putative membrane protein YdjX (TVP38/TMEM64 family) [Oceanicoccus sp.]|jgi:uncharacterized membrane protein YdjX (TVP38/TMEM64 family)
MLKINPKVFKIILLAVVVAAAGFAFHNDLLSYITLENIQAYEKRLGWWAPLAFILAFVLGELLQIPSMLWILFAGLIWPIWIALPIVLVSALLGATTIFLLARYFLGNNFHEKLPANFRALNRKIEKKPLRAIIMVRLTTFLHPIMHWALAASSIRLPAFLLGTLIGILPLTLAIILIGDLFLQWWEQYSNYILWASVAAVILYSVNLKRKKMQTAK